MKKGMYWFYNDAYPKFLKEVHAFTFSGSKFHLVGTLDRFLFYFPNNFFTAQRKKQTKIYIKTLKSGFR